MGLSANSLFYCRSVWHAIKWSGQGRAGPSPLFFPLLSSIVCLMRQEWKSRTTCGICQAQISEWLSTEKESASNASPGSPPFSPWRMHQPTAPACLPTCSTARWVRRPLTQRRRETRGARTSSARRDRLSTSIVELSISPY